MSEVTTIKGAIEELAALVEKVIGERLYGTSVPFVPFATAGALSVTALSPTRSGGAASIGVFASGLGGSAPLVIAPARSTGTGATLTTTTGGGFTTAAGVIDFDKIPGPFLDGEFSPENIPIDTSGIDEVRKHGAEYAADAILAAARAKKAADRAIDAALAAADAAVRAAKAAEAAVESGSASDAEAAQAAAEEAAAAAEEAQIAADEATQAAIDAAQGAQDSRNLGETTAEGQAAADQAAESAASDQAAAQEAADTAQQCAETAEAASNNATAAAGIPAILLSN